jgi:hypothetical protein
MGEGSKHQLNEERYDFFSKDNDYPTFNYLEFFYWKDSFSFLNIDFNILVSSYPWVDHCKVEWIDDVHSLKVVTAFSVW